MSNGPIKVFPSIVASASTFSSFITMGKSFQYMYLETPSMVSGTDFMLNGSTDGSTGRRIMQALPTTASVQVQTFTIGSAATARMIPINANFPYLRVELTTAPVSAYTFNFIGSD